VPPHLDRASSTHGRPDMGYLQLALTVFGYIIGIVTNAGAFGS
jgi:hypothetical protein